jgi:chitodextrinase
MVSVRIPAAQFDSIMSTLRSYAVKVTDDTNSAQDVTQEYMDLSARLKNLEAAETQLTEIMKKATTVTEVLAVQNQLTSTRAEIESTKARIQYLEQTAAMSLITVTLSQASMEISLVAGTRVARSGDSVGFGVQIYGGISPYSYLWDFGDSGTSLEARPWHTYSSAGNYTVSVTVTDDKGNKATDRRESYVSISPGWNAGDIARSAWRGFVGFGRFMGGFAIWMGIFSPVWIVIGVIVILIVRRRRRKKALKAATQSSSAANTSAQ